jgi:nicotinate-nucleotide adenylyltransferase
MAKIGVFGGTFDPIHNGHLRAAQEVASKLHLERILFVPTADSWQKGLVSSVNHRIAMLQLAIAPNPLFQLELTDVERGGSTYTIDTLRDLKAKHPSDELVFILGTDAFAGISTWKEYESLYSLATFAVVTRPRYHLASDRSEKVELVVIEALELSSTLVRQAVQSGQDITGLVPVEVANYIEANNLYEVNA